MGSEYIEVNFLNKKIEKKVEKIDLFFEKNSSRHDQICYRYWDFNSNFKEKNKLKSKIYSSFLK